MPQTSNITDAYIDEIIKSSGPFVDSIHKTQGVKMRELIKRLRDYLESQIPVITADIKNNGGFISQEQLAGFPEDLGLKRPFVIKPLSSWSPGEVYGSHTGQPLHTLLIATATVEGAERVVQMKVSDGVTQFQDLQNLLSISSSLVVASDGETQAGSIDSKAISPLKLKNWWDVLKGQVQLISGRWNFSKVSLGHQNDDNAHLSIAANTSNASQIILTPSETDVVDLKEGSIYNFKGEVKFFGNNILNNFLKIYDNVLLNGYDNRMLEVNQYGDISAVNSIKELYVSDSEIINAILSATYTNNEAVIAVDGKVFYQGQKYYDKNTHLMYEAYNDNEIFRR